MKTTLAILLASIAFAFAGVKTNVTLVWDYPATELNTNLTFKLYSSTNITVPLTNWPVATNVPGTITNVTLPIQPGMTFYFVTASNEFGESDPSNTVTGQVARSGSKVKITPGP